MSRMVSFGVLVGIILALGVLFLRVLWVFWLPLFVALLLALVFRPVYHWFLLRCRGSEYVAAGLTTTAILTGVMVPLLWVFTMSIMQTLSLVTDFELTKFATKASQTRSRLGLDMPFPNDFKAIEASIRKLEELPAEKGMPVDHMPMIGETLNIIWRLQRRLEDPAKLGAKRDEELLPPWLTAANRLDREWWKNPLAREIWRDPELLKLADPPPAPAAPMPPAAETPPEAAEPAAEKPLPPAAPAAAPLDPVKEQLRQVASDPFVAEMAKNKQVQAFWSDSLVKPLVELAETKPDDSSYSPYRASLQRVQLAFLNFRQKELGDPFRAWLLNLLNPSDSELNAMRTQLLDNVNRSVLEITIPTTQLVTDFLIMGGVMILGMFYFFADGPNMVSTAMQLSPLDARYQRQLIEQFDSTARAVVTANLVNALAHGVAAAVGYVWVCESWILLSFLTMALSLIPFLGAACIWMPVSLWLWLYDNQPERALFLGIYGGTVLTAIDYGLRPLLLHGQANIHPLLAFISVLGGVQVLGPIGILLGPIIVLLLQTLLTMLQVELTTMDDAESGEPREDEPPDEDGLVRAPPAAEKFDGAGSVEQQLVT